MCQPKPKRIDPPFCAFLSPGVIAGGGSCAKIRTFDLGWEITLGYAARDKVLLELGFESYAEYLKSDLWKRVRAKVFACRGNRCWLCDQKATQVHHKSYTRRILLGKKFKGLMPICGKCHLLIEFDGKQKTSLGQANQYFRWANPRGRRNRWWRKDQNVDGTAKKVRGFDVAPGKAGKPVGLAVETPP